jgi:hypothetical protein
VQAASARPRDGERARPDHLRVVHTDEVDHQRNGKDRSAAAYEAERESDRAARQCAKKELQRGRQPAFWVPQ